MAYRNITPKRPSRFPNFRYRANPLLPSERAGDIGEWTRDALSGVLFPKIFAVDGPFGTVDGRNGATVDLDTDQHECPITMEGPIPTRITPTGN